MPTLESALGQDALASKSSIYSTYEPSSQIKYSPDKYLIAEKIQNALRQPPAYSQVQITKSSIFHCIVHLKCFFFFQTIVESDPFYGPIVARIDSILSQYTVVSENCKEWLVCNMYRTPAQFSPHSNFLSAELSR